MKPRPEGKAIGWETLSAKYIFESPWHKIRQDKVRLKGEELTYTWLEHPGSVFVVPVTRDGKFVLIRVYRYTIDKWCWEVPAGGLGDKRGISLEQAARDELREETGYTGGTFEKIGFFYAANGVADLEYTIFLARGVELTSKQELEATEQLEVALFTRAELERMLEAGEIVDGEAALCLWRALARLK